MPGFYDTVPADASPDLAFSVISQKVQLDVDFVSQSVSGSTEIVVQPHAKDLKSIRLNCRQACILRATVEGRPAAVQYEDPYEKLKIRGGTTTVHQHEYLRSKIEKHIKETPEPELTLALPSRLVIQELQNDFASAFAREIGIRRQDSDANMAATPTAQTPQELGPRYAPLRVVIDFEVSHFRDGIHWVGISEDDSRYPHLYTKNNGLPGISSSIFPCVDTSTSRCLWDISITCPRTLGHAFGQPPGDKEASAEKTNGRASADMLLSNGTTGPDRAPQSLSSVSLSEEEKALDMEVVCSGELTDNIVDPKDSSKRTLSFACLTPVAARHIGFAIGPFEHLDLSEYRDTDQDEKLGQNAIKVHGFCLPGRADELRNTCMPMAKAIDFFTVNYGSYPFASYKLCFVDDHVQDVADTAALSICSNRLLFPEDIIETLDTNTRILTHALASQYVGVYIIPREATDTWAITGISGYMTDIFMKTLAGNNEFRYRQKLASEKVYELDVDRYSIHQLGSQLDVDPSEYDFMALKSALILFILDRRLTKASGSSGVSRIISRVFLNAKTGDLQNGEISTDYFHRISEKLGHTKLDSFFRQWVYGAGCPIFHVNQRFNKKKLVVEMIITQKQLERVTKPQLQSSTFMREAKEQVSEAWVPAIQPVFTGPMTIRIHEADGTPYEHIVEIKEAQTKFEIPYNTKYKRLKRSKRAKERALAANGLDVGDAHDDVLLYCLGDTLQSEDEVRDWRLSDWSQADEDKMAGESYEWIRMDADFEWIGKIQLTMPVYMHVSQLQQDRDVVAQYESLQYIITQQAHPLMSTILIRTLMDRRYFHGIRTLATVGLAKCAREELGWLGSFHLEKAFQDLFCMPDSSMPRANDFSNRQTYLIQCAIPTALARVRDAKGQVPLAIRKFFVDKLKFNDNSNNEFSDCFYVATLITCLAEALAASVQPTHNYTFNFSNDDEVDEDNSEEDQFKTEAINEIERYRRIDEWITSYHNTYTVTAITCIQRLSQVGAVKDKLAEILQYTRPGNSENVRLRAFGALVDLKMALKPQILKYILFSLCDDLSPSFREGLLRVLGQALGTIAFGDDPAEKAVPKVEADVDSGLVLEQEAPVETRQADIARKTSPEAALIALKQAVADNEVLKSALWHAVQSPTLALSEVVPLLDIAALLFESGSSLVVALPYPRNYRVEHLGKGKLRFYRSSGWRTKPSKYAPLSLEDHTRLKGYKLEYNGPISNAVHEQQAQAAAAAREQQQKKLDLAAQIAIAQQELQRHQQTPKVALSATPRSAMSPPPLPTPIVHEAVSAGGGVLKLSLKRKQSVDQGRAASPKAQKLARAQTANTARAMSPEVQRSPSVSNSSKMRAATPIGATAAATPAPAVKNVASTLTAATATATAKRPKSKSHYSLIVKLNMQRRGHEVKAILAQPANPSISSTARVTPGPPVSVATDRLSGTPLPAPASATVETPAPTASASAQPDLFSAAAMSTPKWNVGGFRNFGGGSAGGLARVKTEDTANNGGASAPLSGISPMTAWPPTSSLSAADSKGDAARDGANARPPVPTRKITLKLGSKAKSLGAPGPPT